MTFSEKYSPDFIEGRIYHIFNTGNNKELLFRSEQRRSLFLHKYEQYLGGLLDTFSWSVTPAEVEILVRVKSIKNIRDYLRSCLPSELTMTEKRFLKREMGLSVLIEQAFKRLFQSYSISFNNYYTRKGNLFHRPFKRLIVESEAHFTKTIIDIHLKPVTNGTTTDIIQYKWSSFPHILSENAGYLQKNEVLARFGSPENMLRCHYKNLELVL
jgi:putative transposase